MSLAVYLLGPNTSHDAVELRYSLRTITAHAPEIDDVVIVGQRPSWYTGQVVDWLPVGPKWIDIRAALTMFVTHPDTPEQFYLFDDDHFITEPVIGHLPAFHLGPCKTQFRAQAVGSWERAGWLTAQWLRTNWEGEPDAYTAHVPLAFETATLAGVLAEYPDQLLLTDALYWVAGAGPEGINVGNAKVNNFTQLATKLAQPMPYLSSGASTWPGAVADWIIPRFPAPSRWETP